jgi:DNA-directed RNA polymerase subunit RPC12/RpoP
MTYTCANCGMEQLDLKFTDLVEEKLRVDDLILCGGCGLPNKVTLEGLALLNQIEFELLSKDEKRDLDFAQRAIKKKLLQS